jgi:hypothetical protein
MGEVYRARDTKLQGDVALKILPEAFATDPEPLARFEREAKTLACSTIHTSRRRWVPAARLARGCVSDRARLRLGPSSMSVRLRLARAVLVLPGPCRAASMLAAAAPR